jgi:SNF2 family DNA or RNA helicase
VGLGKTIEAGLAIRSLYLSGIVKRVLIAPPASLTHQWQREMASKFFLPFALVKGGSNLKHDYIFPFEKNRSGLRMYDPDLCIVSTGLLSRTQRLEELQNSMPFDLSLVDEAHSKLEYFANLVHEYSRMVDLSDNMQFIKINGIA